MSVESIRRFCLGLPQAKENLQWGDNLCFKVGGKIFAVLALGSVPQGLSLKCTPEKFDELLEQEGIIPAPYVGRYKWILLERLDALPAAELKDLIRQSYEMVSAKLPKRRGASRKSLKFGKRRKVAKQIVEIQGPKAVLKLRAGPARRRSST